MLIHRCSIEVINSNGSQLEELEVQVEALRRTKFDNSIVLPYSTENELILELHGRYGVNIQWKAVRMVIRLNWRGIIMATIAVFTANLVCINALIDKAKTQDITAFLIRSLEWVKCIRTPGNTIYSCEYAALNILNLWRAWSADLLISLLGTEYFLLESSRK